jgi:adenine/guanine phosphoribosyltransferase-like PRPP-binding protein
MNVVGDVNGKIALLIDDIIATAGTTTKAAEAVARRFRGAGFPEADVQVVGPNPRNKNLVVR